MKPSRISTKLKIIGGTLSLMVFLIIGLTVAMNERSKKDSLIINIAGKERMLSQKMSKEIFFLRHRDGHDFRALDAAIALFENNLNDLRFGNGDRGIYGPQNSVIKEKLDEVNAKWEPFKAELEKIKSGILSVKNEKEILSRRIENLLAISETIVQEMVKRDLKAEYIDLSGRQRMLSQRMGLFVERYLRTDNQEDYLLFTAAKALYDETLEGFVKAEDLKADANLHALLKLTQKRWQEFDVYLMNLLSVEDSINNSVAYIYQNNVKLLDAMDEAVWLYTEHSEQKNQLFLNSLYLSAILALVIILYAFTVARDMMNNIDRFVERAKRLANAQVATPETVAVPQEMEAELQEASSYLQTYVSKVSKAMNSSEDAIKRAENALNELQSLSEEVEDALRDLHVDEETKEKLGKSMNQTEDIAIESSESLLHVAKMLQKLKDNLNSISKSSQDTKPS
jgi:nitrate/nitrite-specific signal transduction histidine kinase